MASVFMAGTCEWLFQNTPQCSCPERAMRARASRRTTATHRCTVLRSLAPKIIPTSSHPRQHFTSPTYRECCCKGLFFFFFLQFHFSVAPKIYPLWFVAWNWTEFSKHANLEVFRFIDAVMVSFNRKDKSKKCK